MDAVADFGDVSVVVLAAGRVLVASPPRLTGGLVYGRLSAHAAVICLTFGGD